MANLALTYGKQGRFNQGNDLLSQAFQLKEVMMGSQHPTTIWFRKLLESTEADRWHTDRKG